MSKAIDFFPLQKVMGKIFLIARDALKSSSKRAIQQLEEAACALVENKAEEELQKLFHVIPIRLQVNRRRPHK